MRYTTPDPKPLRDHRPPKRMKKQPARRLLRSGSDPGRLEFARSLPCIGVLCFDGHVCLGDVEASHDRNHTGLGRKEKDSQTVPKCSALHREWEQHTGPFKGWSNEARHAFMFECIARVNYVWDGLTEEQRDAWQGRAEEMRRRRAEQKRGW